jgi:uncharacterized membrane protein YeiH
MDWTAHMDLPLGAIRSLDVFGIFVFAATGALAAAKKKQTFVTFLFFATATGVGGGTLRDLLIGAPVFWTENSLAIATCFAASATIWFLPRKLWTERAFDWLDAAGLASYSVYGCWKALAFNVAPLSAAVMGVITACVGGIIRDILAGEPSIILRPEIYVTAAALSSGLFLGLHLLGVGTIAASVISVAAGFALRGAAITAGLRLPGYRRQ